MPTARLEMLRYFPSGMVVSEIGVTLIVMVPPVRAFIRLWMPSSTEEA